MVAKMNGLICGGRLEATYTDVATLLQTLSHTQTMSTLNVDKFENTFCVSNGRLSTLYKDFTIYAAMPEQMP